jgi:CRP/FNR family transcriptional regulator, cyclic AMP receptor protein
MARDTSKKMQHIQSVPLFKRLNKKQLERVARHADEVTVPAGKVLSREGHSGGRELLIIVDGKLKVERGGLTLATLGPGEFVGEMSLLDGQPFSATVTAETDVVLLVIGRTAFKPMIDDMPGFKDNILLALVQRLRAADERLIC